jgi:nitrate reductase / nitrite oxidoreductase, beta subunit
VENLYALWTYDEILIVVPAQLHTPVARSKSLLTGTDVKVEWTANCGQAAGSSGSTRTGSTCCA